MELRTVLDQLKSASGAGMEKMAGAGEIPKTSAAQEELFHALNTALGATEKDPNARDRGEKTASADAVDELTKMAATLANADREVMKKEAESFGAAVMDGFISRGAEYGIPLVSEKTATVQPEGNANAEAAEAAEFEKWAATPEGKEAIEAYNEGYKQASVEIKKLASTPEGQETLASFRQGYADTVQQLEAIANSENGQEKLAALKKGFEDGAVEAEKLAEDTYVRGYNDAVDLINGMSE